MMQSDLLIEIHTEELPPKSLNRLALAFKRLMDEQLRKAELAFASITNYATPRRIALLVKDLASTQNDQTVERKGPATKAAFNADGSPTQAAIGFARSLNMDAKDLYVIKSKQGEWVGLTQHIKGKTVQEIIPSLLEQVLSNLPIAKRMRWGAGNAQFVRPVHSIIILYGEHIIPANLLDCDSNRVTQGHRFLAPVSITIPTASAYASLLETEGYVIADFDKRQDKIRQYATECVQKQLGKNAQVLMSDPELLDEVTGIVEWPVALSGSFAESFLDLPKEVLISSMQDHQRYFPVVDEAQKLLPYFVTISNIKTNDPKRIIHGNERVLRARLADAEFFYQTDRDISLATRRERLKGIIFQAKLGTLYDKSERLGSLTATIAGELKADTEEAKVAGQLAKADLTTDMVNEFPELQGIMGYYYALHEKQPDSIALALKEQYLPRYAGDELANTPIGQALAIADRIDTLVGTFGINQIPTGDKDPFGLRRAAVGVLRTLIEKQLNLDLKALLTKSLSYYNMPLSNQNVVEQVLLFMHERLRAYYQDQNIPMDVFAAVSAVSISSPLDIDKRIKAVLAFKQLHEAESLSIANKRVSNILAKYTEKLALEKINPKYFEHDAEKELAQQIELKSQAVSSLFADDNYTEVLHSLAELRGPIDNFFDHVMVMTDNREQRENRLLLLSKLRALFLQVADIALLQ